jgi:lipid-A-disaccharide synthase
MAVILPFEVAFYRGHGVAAEFVGHPLLEDFAPERDRDAFLRKLQLSPDRSTIALLSGSRRHEVECILPLMLRASLRVLESVTAQFLVSIAQTIDAAQVARIMEETLGRADRPEYRVSAQPARDLLACSDFGMVKCGTSTLEAALVGTPFLITYRIAPLSWLLGNILIRSRLKGLVNLMVGEEVVPELLQPKATPEALATVALGYLRSPEKMNLMRSKLARMREMLGARNASESVAAMVAGYL